MPLREHLVHGSGEQDLKGPRKQTAVCQPKAATLFISLPASLSLPPSAHLSSPSRSSACRPKCHYAGTGYTLYAHVIKRAGGREVGSRERQRGGERGASRGGQTRGIVMQMCLIGQASRPYVRLCATSVRVALQRDEHAKPNH